MACILGLGGGYNHDASACLVQDGRILAFAEEERFSRRKHGFGSRSCARAAAFCLDRAGIRLDEVDEIVVGWNASWPRPTERVESRRLIDDLLDPDCFGGFAPRSLRVLPHHLAHAASAFHCSGFDDAAVLVVDGSGDGISTSVWRGTPDGLTPLREYPFSQSLGWFYEAVAGHVGLGDWTNAGKLMGLAGYGSPRHELDFVRETSDGYLIDLSRHGLPTDEDVTGQYADLEFYWRFRAAVQAALADAGVPPQAPSRRYDVRRGGLANETEFRQEHVDLAASAQQKLERCMLRLARCALSAAASSSLCIAGGVGLSCSANGVLCRESGASRLFVQPVAGDAGIAMGGALEVARERGDLRLPAAPFLSIALGPEFTDEAIGQLLERCGLRFHHAGEQVAEWAADSLAAGRVVGWFQGRMEGGPRALGQRSILADPRSTSVRDRINRDVKRREMWRPLAPSMLSTGGGLLLATTGPAEFMVVAHHVTGAARDLVPGVVHVDGTVRPHVVQADAGTPYAALIRAFEERTGVPAVLNTSFNHESEPIVCTPADAIRTFYSSPIDELVIGGYVVTKPGSGGRS